MGNNFCPNCGKEASGTSFCAHCGASQATNPTERFTYDWWCHAGSPRHENFNRLERTINRETIQGLRPRWATRIGGGVHNQAIVVQGHVYFGSGKERGVYCLDALTGKQLWVNIETGIYNSNSGTLIGAPAVVGPWLYCSYDYGPIWRLDAKTGLPDENAHVGGNGQSGTYDTLVCDESDLYAVDYNMDMIQITPINDPSKNLDWQPGNPYGHKLKTSPGQPAAPAIADGRMIMATSDGYLDIYTRGSLIKSVKPPKNIFPYAFEGHESDQDDDSDAKLTVTDGTYALCRLNSFLSGSDDLGIINAYDIAKGKFIWQYSKRDVLFTDVALSPNAAVCADSAGVVHALDPKSGRIIWKQSVQDCGAINGTPLIVGDLVYFVGENGLVAALDSTDGSLVWSDQVGYKLYGAPTVCSGYLYFGSEYGLHAYSL